MGRLQTERNCRVEVAPWARQTAGVLTLANRPQKRVAPARVIWATAGPTGAIRSRRSATSSAGVSVALDTLQMRCSGALAIASRFDLDRRRVPSTRRSEAPSVLTWPAH